MDDRDNYVPGLFEALERQRAESPVDWTPWSDEDADKYVELTLPIYGLYPSEDTACEPHRGFALVWNHFGLWRVDVKNNEMTKLA